MVTVNKGKWDESDSLKYKHKFNKKWIKKCYRILKDNGTIWISGTLHNIYSIGMALEEEGFKIINNITWQKTNPPPNLACKTFTHSTETILWARKNIKKCKYKFNYELMKEMNNGKQMKDVWTTSLTKPSEKKCGRARTPKHIHWVIDMLLKEQKNHNDVITFIKCMQKTWDEIVGLESNDYIMLKDTLLTYKSKVDKEISKLTLEGRRVSN